MSTETVSDSSAEQIPEYVLSDLRSAGVSRLFLRVIQTPVSEIPNAERNSARREVLKYMEWSEDSGKPVSEYLNYGGGFFQNLRNGRTGGADSDNQAIIEFLDGGSTTGVQTL